MPKGSKKERFPNVRYRSCNTCRAKLYASELSCIAALQCRHYGLLSCSPRVGKHFKKYD